MEKVLSLVEGLNARAQEIFDRLDATCDHMDTRLSGLEGRLSHAAERIERARGSTAALKVQSARTFQGRGEPSLHAARRVLDENLLISLHSATPLPELPEDRDQPVSATAAAEDLARVYKCVNRHRSLGAPQARVQEKLLPADRLSSVSELFLLNSSEQPYKVRHEVDNLAEPEDEAFYHGQREGREGPKASVEQVDDVDLEEDEPLREHEDLRFRPRPAAEVTFDLPDVLPDLGHVAHIVWREGEHSSETARPAWDAPPPELGRASVVAQKPRPPPPAPRRAPPAAPVKPIIAPQPLLAPSAAPAAPKPQVPQAAPRTAPPSQPTPAQPAPAQTPQPSATPAPAPPKPAAKGKGPKGKGKGKGPPAPPPPPAKKAPAAKAPTQTKQAAVGKSAMFADIRAGAKLRKVAPPKERSGAAVGRVV
ncbi:ANKRD50 [Symbiodinium natans]|uniref:ANKRD50 protein n=1 Tax=Symbiodinium natans TaxID=878477 RepID=A0A812I9S4_9DINO|nr:ANKRD50 [Symbiodinium natans]